MSNPSSSNFSKDKIPMSNPSKIFYQFPKNNYVIHALDDNLPYSFYGPLLCLLWRHMGYVPVFLSYIEKSDLSQMNPRLLYVLESIKHFGGIIVFVPLVKGYVKGVPEMTSRYFASILDFDPESYIIISDMDMLPMNKQFFDLRSKNDNHVTLWNPFAVSGNAHGSCYIGMTAKLWREVLELPNTIFRDADFLSKYVKEHLKQHLNTNNEMEQWKYDQIMFTKKLEKWSNHYTNKRVHFVDRKRFSRLDRSRDFWTYDPKSSHLLYAESHVARPIHHGTYENVWRIIMKIASTVLDSSELVQIEKWFKNYLLLDDTKTVYTKVWS